MGNQWERPSESQKREIERQVTENVDRLVAKQAEEYLRRLDEAELYRCPDRLEEQRIWNSYTAQVSAAAWQQGNQSDEWVRRWRQLIADRAAAEQYGDPTGALDARLERHVGTPYPQLPDAAWDSADLLPATERQAEYDRLTVKYGPREPATDTPARRRARK
jgi:hypothetical protein